MVDQVKSVDYISRKAKFVEKASAQLLDDVIHVIEVCIN